MFAGLDLDNTLKYRPGRRRWVPLALMAVLPSILVAVAASSEPYPALAAPFTSELEYPFLYPMSANQFGGGPAPSGHDGYDIYGWTYHAPVYASWSGYADVTPYSATCTGGPNDPNPGQWVQINHGSVRSNYMHLSSLAFASDRWVNAGQLIGYEGQTGNACTDHLHMEWRRNSDGQPMNLNAWVPHDVYTQVTAGSPIAFRGVWLLNSYSDGTTNKYVVYGARGDIPVVGDWNMNGRDTIGYVRLDQTPGSPTFGEYYWHLSNGDLVNAANGATMSDSYTQFRWGLEGDVVITGDWDGNNSDTPGVVRYNPSTGLSDWWQTNNVTAGAVHNVTNWGSPGRFPVVGDWNGDGVDTPGIFWPEGQSWWLTNTAYYGGGNSLMPGTPFGWGWYADPPLSGDWQSNNYDRPIVYQKIPDTFGTNPTWTRGNAIPPTANYSFNWGTRSNYPLVLNWDADVYDEYALLQ